MQEDANQNCSKCHGEGEVYKYFANHRDRYVLFEWLYCNECFPYSSGYWPTSDITVEIDSLEFDRLQEEEGYSDYTGC